MALVEVGAPEDNINNLLVYPHHLSGRDKALGGPIKALCKTPSSLSVLSSIVILGVILLLWGAGRGRGWGQLTMSFLCRRITGVSEKKAWMTRLFLSTEWKRDGKKVGNIG